MGVAAGRARAQAETLQTGGAPAARATALPSASLTIATKRVTAAIAPRTVRDYLFLIEWQSTNQPTNPPTKRATSEASEPSKQPVLIPLKRARGALSVSPSSVVDLLRLDLTDFEFEKSNRFAQDPTRVSCPLVLARSLRLADLAYPSLLFTHF